MYKFRLLFFSFLLFAFWACSKKKEEKQETIVFKPKTPTEEIAEVSRLLESNPQDVLLLKRRGNLYLKMEQYFKAASDFKWGIFYDDRDLDLFIGLSNAFKFQGKIDSALFTIDLIERNLIPTNDVYLLKGEIFLIRGDHKKAIEYFDNVLKSTPFFAKAYYMKGLAFAEMRDTVKAISSVQTAIEQDPEFLDAYNTLSGLYVGKKNYQAGVQALRSAFLLNPNDELLNINLGIVYRLLGEADSSLKYYKRATIINPNNKEACLAAAQQLILLKKGDEALKFINEYPVVTQVYLQLKHDAFVALNQPDSVKKYAQQLKSF